MTSNSPAHEIPNEGAYANDGVYPNNVVYPNSVVYIDTLSEKGQGVFAAKEFQKGERVIMGKELAILSKPTAMSLQVNANTHIHIDRPFESVNHSCNPNCGIEHNAIGGYSLIALKKITPNEEIVFDYAMSEWICVGFTQCLCGEHNCRGNAIGASQVNPNIVLAYRPYISKFIESVLQAEPQPISHTNSV